MRGLQPASGGSVAAGLAALVRAAILGWGTLVGTVATGAAAAPPPPEPFAIEVAVERPQTPTLPDPFEIQVVVERPQTPTLPDPFKLQVVVERPDFPLAPEPFPIEVTVGRPQTPALLDPFEIRVVVERRETPSLPDPFEIQVEVERPQIPLPPEPFSVQVTVVRARIPSPADPFPIEVTVERPNVLPSERLGEILAEIEELTDAATKAGSLAKSSCTRADSLIQQWGGDIEALGEATDVCEREFEVLKERELSEADPASVGVLSTEAEVASEELALLRDRAGLLREAFCGAGATSQRSTPSSSRLSEQARAQLVALRQARDGLERLARPGGVHTAESAGTDLRSRLEEWWRQVGEIGSGLEVVGDEVERAKSSVQEVEAGREQGRVLLDEGLALSDGDPAWTARLQGAFGSLQNIVEFIGGCPLDQELELVRLQNELQSVGGRMESLLSRLDQREAVESRGRSKAEAALAEAEALLAVGELFVETIENRIREAEACAARAGAESNSGWETGAMEPAPASGSDSAWQTGSMDAPCQTPAEASFAIQGALGRLQAAMARADRYAELLSSVAALAAAAADPAVCPPDRARVRDVLERLQSAQATQLEQAGEETADALARGRARAARRDQAWSSAATALAGALDAYGRAAAAASGGTGGAGGNGSGSAGEPAGGGSECATMQAGLQRKIAEWQSLLSRRPVNDKDGSWCRDVLAWQREFTTLLQRAESANCAEVSGSNPRAMLDQVRTLSSSASCN